MDEKLKELGFKKCYPDNVDKKYFFWRKNIKHPFLKGLHIIVGENISVYCKEDVRNEVMIHLCKRNEYNLIAVNNWLTQTKGE